MFLCITKKQIISCLILLFLLLILLTTISFAHLNSYSPIPSTSDLGLIVSDQVKKQLQELYSSEKKVAYLTFDDGPSNKVTPKILDILKKFEIKANFFVLGKKVEENPDVFKRTYEEGHFIANHGYSHNNKKFYQNKETFLEEIQKTDTIIGKVLNIPNYSCHLFRFPNGSKSKQYYQEKQKCISYLQDIDYTYIDWNSLNNDSIRKCNASQLISNLKKSIKGKNTLIILMHDSGDVNKTYDTLESSITLLQQEGYSFQTFQNILFP